MIGKTLSKIIWGAIKATLLICIGYGFYRQPALSGIMLFLFILSMLGMDKLSGK
jgi:hypothetical protein